MHRTASKKKVAFGTSSVRTAPMIRTHEDLFPGPAHYTNTDNKPKQQDVQLSSTFASLTDRLHSPPPIVKVKFPSLFMKYFIIIDTVAPLLLEPVVGKTHTARFSFFNCLKKA